MEALKLEVLENDQERKAETGGVSWKEAVAVLGWDSVITGGAYRSSELTAERFPFSLKDIEAAKNLNMQLIFCGGGSDNSIGSNGGANYARAFTKEELSYHEESYSFDRNAKNKCKNLIEDDDSSRLFREPPERGWRLSSKYIVLGSSDKTYLEQTDFLRNQLYAFFGNKLPEKYRLAILEFNEARTGIKIWADSDEPDDQRKAVMALMALQINKLCRESAPEAFYRLSQNMWRNHKFDDNPLKKSQGEEENRLLLEDESWTRTLDKTHDNSLVSVGGYFILDDRRPEYDRISLRHRPISTRDKKLGFCLSLKEGSVEL